MSQLGGLVGSLGLSPSADDGGSNIELLRERFVERDRAIAALENQLAAVLTNSQNILLSFSAELLGTVDDDDLYERDTPEGTVALIAKRVDHLTQALEHAKREVRARDLGIESMQAERTSLEKKITDLTAEIMAVRARLAGRHELVSTTISGVRQLQALFAGLERDESSMDADVEEGASESRLPIMVERIRSAVVGIVKARDEARANLKTVESDLVEETSKVGRVVQERDEARRERDRFRERLERTWRKELEIRDRLLQQLGPDFE